MILFIIKSKGYFVNLIRFKTKSLQNQGKEIIFIGVNWSK